MKKHGSRRLMPRRLILVTVVTAVVEGSFFMPATLAQQNQQGRGGQVPAADTELRVLPVQGNISMIVGDGGNVTMSVGEEGVLLVDTGLETNADKLIAFVRKLAPDKPISYIINTHVHADHTGGNAKVAAAGQSIVAGNFAAQVGPEGARMAFILAHEQVLGRMSAPTGEQSPTPSAAWPTDTYTNKKELYFNGESIVIEHQPNAHTDGDSIVWFRKSDVVSAGDVFLTTTFPIVDEMRGGHINGIIDGLNRIIDIAVPRDKQEGGTYVIPGHGRLCDEADVVEYRDMVTIVRDRVADLVKKGRTLQQVKDSNPVLDYEGRYGAKTGFWTTDAFVTAVYNTLSKTLKTEPAKNGKTTTSKPVVPKTPAKK